MLTCCGNMLKFIRCMRNKLAGSSDVCFAGYRRMSFGDRKYRNVATKKCIADALFLSGIAELLV